MALKPVKIKRIGQAPLRFFGERLVSSDSLSATGDADGATCSICIYETPRFFVAHILLQASPTLDPLSYAAFADEPETLLRDLINFNPAQHLIASDILADVDAGSSGKAEALSLAADRIRCRLTNVRIAFTDALNTLSGPASPDRKAA